MICDIYSSFVARIQISSHFLLAFVFGVTFLKCNVLRSFTNSESVELFIISLYIFSELNSLCSRLFFFFLRNFMKHNRLLTLLRSIPLWQNFFVHDSEIKVCDEMIMSAMPYLYHRVSD